MTDWIGKRIGNYEITGWIGRGGMSTVYRARQITIPRDVAIKILNLAEGVTLEVLTRFEREVQIIASLEHIHILPIYDYGLTDEYSYLVMRYLDGGSLNARIKGQPLPLPEIDRIVSQIASALDYAHSCGVVHRDLKPHNILMDRQNNAFLSDFGIAKLIAADQSLTQTGIAIGTPGYMAPEQWQGDTVDSHTDVYALGIMIYEMLTGFLPFQSESVLSLMQKHLHETPPSILKVRPDISPTFNQIIWMAMAKNAEDRFSSAGELANAVSSALAVRGTTPLSGSPVGAAADRPTQPNALDDAPTQFVGSEPTWLIGRTWVLEVFEHWRKTAQHPVFFITGPNGIGKSELAALLSAAIKSRTISYELNSADAHSLDPRFFVDSVIRQLNTIIPDAVSHSTTHVMLAAFADPVELFDKRVLEPISMESAPVYLLLDGLEAAFEHPGTTIVDLVQTALDSLPETLRLIVTAAPNQELDKLLHDAERVELQPYNEADRAQLIATLSTHFAALLPSLSRGEIDLQALEQKSEGNPLYLTTVFEHLAFKRLMTETLDDIPSGLDNLYTFLIDRAQQLYPHACNLLYLLAAARASIPGSLLANILGEPADSIVSTLGSLRPLVVLGDDGWELAHPALRYVLIDYHEADVLQAHRRIAEALGRYTPAQMDQYALQHLVAHLLACDEAAAACTLLTDLNFLEAKMSQRGLNEVVADFTFARSALENTENSPAAILDLFLNILHELAPFLIAHPDASFTILYNRLAPHHEAQDLLATSIARRRAAWLRMVWPLQKTVQTEAEIIWQGTAVHTLSVNSNSDTNSSLLAACNDNYLRLWTDGEMQEWDNQPAIGATLLCGALHGSLVISGYSNGALCLWNLEQRVVIRQWNGHRADITAVVFSPDGNTLLSASADRLIQLWDTHTGKLIQPFQQHPAAVSCCALLPINTTTTLAISGADDGIVRVWNTLNGNLVWTLKEHRNRVSALAAFVADNATNNPIPIAISGSADGEVCIWNLQSGELLHRRTGHTARITAIYATPQAILTASEDRTVRWWSLDRLTALAKLEPHRGVITGCTLLPDGHVLSASLDGTIRISTIVDNHDSPVIETHSAQVTSAAFTPDGSCLVTTSLDRGIKLWDVESGRLLRTLSGHTGGVNACSVRSDGHGVLTASSDGTLRYFDLHTAGALKLYGEHHSAVTACAISPFTLKLDTAPKPIWVAASGGADRSIRLWNLETGQTLATLKGHGDTITDCAFSPNGKLLVSASKDNSVRVWAVATHEVTRAIIGLDAPVVSCVFTADSEHILLGFEDGRIQQVDVEVDGLGLLHGKQGKRLERIGLSVNNQILFAVFADKTLRLWQTRDHHEYKQIGVYCATNGLSAVAMSPDNVMVAVGDAKGGVSLLRMETQSAPRRKTKTT